MDLEKITEKRSTRVPGTLEWCLWYYEEAVIITPSEELTRATCRKP